MNPLCKPSGKTACSRKAGIVQYCLNDSSIQTKKRGPANRQAHAFAHPTYLLYHIRQGNIYP